MLQRRLHLLQAASLTHFQPLRLDVNINMFTDQLARHRVGVGADVDRASLGDAGPPSVPGVHTARGEIAQIRPFLGESLSPPTVALSAKFPQELLVTSSMVELAAAAEQQRLIDGGLESVMALLGISILMGLAVEGTARRITNGCGSLGTPPCGSEATSVENHYRESF